MGQKYTEKLEPGNIVKIDYTGYKNRLTVNNKDCK